jgi:hypothetical protein
MYLSSLWRRESTMALDPENHAWIRLALFWHAYAEEFKLLESWHISTERAQRPTGNILYDSFLDTWGKGKWNEVEDDSVPFEKRTYFQALGVVSHQLLKHLRNVLNTILVSDGDKFKLPPELKPGIDPKDADKMAQGEIDKITTALDRCVIPGLEKADKEVKNVLDNCPKDPYLNALLRMMLIETKCFKIQRHFLEKGEILPESA